MDQSSTPDLRFVLADPALLQLKADLVYARLVAAYGEHTPTSRNPLRQLIVFGHAVLPVDTHVHRVSQRLGLIPPRASAEKAHTLLLRLLPADSTTLYTFHRNAIQHGKRICFFHAPACRRCPLLDICDYGGAERGQ